MFEGLREFLVSASRGGGRNFRTLVSGPTVDGFHVARSLVYRSGHLGQLTEDLRAELGGLGVRTVVTFQTQREIDILGDPLPALLPGAVREHIPIGDRWFQKGGILPDDTSSQGQFYVTMVRDHADLWARFLRLFARRDCFPLLYHCTAGRDRTGVATVLLLETLKLPRAEIVTDYLISNQVFEENVQEPEVLVPLFEAIDDAGGIEGFLRTLGVEAGDVAAIRNNLLSKG